MIFDQNRDHDPSTIEFSNLILSVFMYYTLFIDEFLESFF